MKNYWIPAVIISALLAGCSPSEDEAEQVTEEEKKCQKRNLLMAITV